MVRVRNAAHAEESAEVEVLLADANKFGDISKRMKASLDRLQSGGDVVKQSMGPVYSNTQSLHVMNTSRFDLVGRHLLAECLSQTSIGY